MSDDDTIDDCPKCNFAQRVGRYLLLRLKEPSTWAGITAMLTGVGVKLAPDQQAVIISLGTFIAGMLLTVMREGAIRPENPSIGAVITGNMPPARQNVVTPAAADPPKEPQP